MDEGYKEYRRDLSGFEDDSRRVRKQTTAKTKSRSSAFAKDEQLCFDDNFALLSEGSKMSGEIGVAVIMVRAGWTECFMRRKGVQFRG